MVYFGVVVLCYVVYYEGFGLFFLEVMFCGIFVFFGNNSFMFEVVRDGGVGVDVGSVGVIWVGMEEVLIVDGVDLGKVVLCWARVFFWLWMAYEIFLIYQQVSK